MKKVLLGIILYALLSGVGYSEELITACGDPDYPPFTYVRRPEKQEPKLNQEIEGVAPDVLKIIFSEMGFKVDAKYVGNWKRCQYNVENGVIDIMMGAYITEDRKKYALYSETPLASDPQSVFVWKGKEFKFDKWEDLKGKRAGLTLGFSTGTQFDDFLEKNTVIERVPDHQYNYRKLEAGRIDFEPNGLYAGLIKIRESGYEGKIVALPTPINTEYLYTPMSKLSKYLKYYAQFENHLKKLRDDGTVERLIRKHIEQYGISK